MALERYELIVDPRAPPQDLAQLLMEHYAGQPVSPQVVDIGPR